MKSHPLIRFALFLLLGVLWSPLAVLGESLFDYTSRCERELEIPQNSIKGFTCDVNSEILPTEQFGTACDSQPLLGNGCLGNSRMGIMTFSSNPDVMGPWICRKYRGFDTAGGGVYHDVALIIHNRKNGKTCFFQNKLDSTPIGVTPVVLGDGPIIPGPKDSNAHSVWRDPQGVVAAAICTSCHTNDPFIVTPHVATAFDTFGLTRFNPNGLYSVVGGNTGETFASFTDRISRVDGCGGMCHFKPNAGFESDAINNHWMPPGSMPNEHYAPYKFNPIGGQFYSLRDNGEVRGFNGRGGGACNNGVCPHWTVLGNHHATVEIAASANKVYSRETTGLIRQFAGVQCTQVDNCPEWTLLDNNPKSAQIVSGNGILYQMWNSGPIWRHTGTPCTNGNCPGWQLLDNNSQTVEIVASGLNLFQRHKNGNVWKFTGTPCSGSSCPGWQLIASDSRTIDLVAGGSFLYMFQQSGAIWKFTGTPCSGGSCPGWLLIAPANNGATKQVAAGSGELYRLHTNGEVWRYLGTGQNWVMIDAFSGNVEIAASSTGLLVRHALGDVWRFIGDSNTQCSNGSCPGWIQIQRPNTIALTGARP